MSVKIRLSRVGKKHVPFFRVVAIDSRKKRDGKVLDNLGTFDGLNSKIVRFDTELYESWIAKGAIPSDSVKKIVRLSKKASKPAEPKKAAAPKQAAPKKSAEKQAEETPKAE